MSNSLRPHGLQHVSLLCSSLSPGVCWDSCPLNQWCYLTILCHALSSCPQSFPATGSFTMNQLFTSGGQSVGASASVLPMNIQGWFPLDLIFCSPRNLKSLLQHHNSKTSILWHSAFFMVQLTPAHDYG